MGIKWQDGVTALVAVIYMDMECRHIKRQDFLILKCLRKDLTLKYYKCKI